MNEIRNLWDKFVSLLIEFISLTYSIRSSFLKMNPKAVFIISSANNFELDF